MAAVVRYYLVEEVKYNNVDKGKTSRYVWEKETYAQALEDYKKAAAEAGERLYMSKGKIVLSIFVSMTFDDGETRARLRQTCKVEGTGCHADVEVPLELFKKMITDSY